MSITTFLHPIHVTPIKSEIKLTIATVTTVAPLSCTMAPITVTSNSQHVLCMMRISLAVNYGVSWHQVPMLRATRLTEFENSDSFHALFFNYVNTSVARVLRLIVRQFIQNVYYRYGDIYKIGEFYQPGQVLLQIRKIRNTNSQENISLDLNLYTFIISCYRVNRIVI